MKKPELILHIGLPKTGTTSIHHSLDCNKELLASNGIYYGEYNIQKSHKNVYLALFFEAYKKVFNIDIDKDNFFGNSFLPFYEPSEKIFNNMLQSFYSMDKMDKIILSESQFLNFLIVRKPYVIFKPTYDEDKYKQIRLYFKKKLLEIFSDFDIKICIYLRRPDLWSESWYLQALKDQNAYPVHKLNSYLKDLTKRFDYYYPLMEYSDFFGKKNIIVRPFERGQLTGGDVVEDFYVNALGIDKEYYESDEFEKGFIENIKLNLDVIEFKRKLNIVDHNSNETFIQTSNNLENKTARKSYIPIQVKKELLAYFSESNRKIAQEFLHREDGILFYDKLDETQEEYKGLTVDTTIDVAREFIKNLLEKNLEEKNRCDAYYKILNQWLKLKANGVSIADYLISKGIKNIAIYGMGELGQRLCEDLINTEIQIIYCIDKLERGNVMGFDLINIESINLQTKVDAIIVTPIHAFDSISEELKKTCDVNLINFEDVVFKKLNIMVM